MASYGEHTYLECTIENHANLLMYVTRQTDHCISQRMALTIKHQGGPPFPRLCSSLLCHYRLMIKCQNGLLLKRSCMYCRLLINTQICTCVHWFSTHAQLSPLYMYLLSTVTHVMNYYFRSSPAFPYWGYLKCTVYIIFTQFSVTVRVLTKCL